MIKNYIIFSSLYRGGKRGVSWVAQRLQPLGNINKKHLEMIKKLEIKTSSRSEIIDITDKIQKVISDSKIISGICILYVPHTTAGIIVNENYDPSVRADILESLGRIAPASARYKHTEGNADSHIKTSLVGSSATLLIEDGKILLGSWQGIMFCEFDGPRTRKLVVKVIQG